MPRSIPEVGAMSVIGGGPEAAGRGVKVALLTRNGHRAISFRKTPFVSRILVERGPRDQQ
jgi:hypothetical protein